MATQFRIRLLFTLRFLLLYGYVLSARAYVNQDLRTCPINFDFKNPHRIAVTGGTRTYLHCDVSTDIDEQLAWDLLNKEFYHFDDEDDEKSPEVDPSLVKQFYQDQKKKYNKDDPKNEPSLVVTDVLRLHKRNNNKKQSNDINDTHFRRRAQRLRRDTARIDMITYEWLRNDNSFMNVTSVATKAVTVDSFALFPNGTLALLASNLTAGTYRCRAVVTFEVRHNTFDIGPILSTKTTVDFAYLTNDATEKRPVTVTQGRPVVIVCPIRSVPEPTISWTFRDEKINFDVGTSVARRRFLLRNGSLLIVNSRQSDSGKYLCTAETQFSKKPLQNSAILNVLSRTDKDDDYDDGGEKSTLLPHLQDSVLEIKARGNLVLHCAANAGKISWTFLPRNANQTIPLSEFNNELRYVNVSVEKHDGIYNCSTESEFQTFDVTVATSPKIVSNQTSKRSSMPGSIQFNCSATGNPKPIITWYKDGELITNNHIKYARGEILKIETIDPFDEGLYQCFARNDFGEVSGTYYLHLPPRNLLNSAPSGLKCYSTPDNTITVEFQKDESERASRVQYFIAVDNPRDFDTSFSSDLLGKSSIVLSKGEVKIAKSLKPFHVYMRAMLASGGLMTMSQLSKPVVCAFQEIEPKFIKAQNGTFITWSIGDLSHEELSKAIITIQFLKNGTNAGNVLQFGSEAVGTYAHFSDIVQWNDVEKNLQKIAVQSSDQPEYTEIKVSGNVTGILIIKIEEIFVRIFGSIEENGAHLQQNFSQMKWKSVNLTFAPLNITKIESRSIEIGWSGLDEAKCLRACTNLKLDMMESIRSSKNKIVCEKISDPSAKHFYIRGLKPTSNYDVYIKDCNGNFVSTEVEFLTLRDVPGPVVDSYFGSDKELTLHWKPPVNPNGEISHYTIDWTANNVTHSANSTDNFFKFPNTKPDDKFYITVRAFGEGGLGNPLIIDPKRSEMYNSMRVHPTLPEESIFDGPFFIIAIILICLLLIALIIGFVVYQRRNNRFSKNDKSSEQQSPFSIVTPCTIVDNLRCDMYEMQTLIPTSQNNSTSTMANGRDNAAKAENLSNGDVTGEGSNILRTSTPTEELTSMTEICDEPPIKCDTESAIQITDERKLNGLLKTFQAMAPAMVVNKTPEKGMLKVNGNSSPYKCLQSSMNDQNSSSESSSFDSDSTQHQPSSQPRQHQHEQQQLIDISSLCNGLNNNNNNINNNSNHHHSSDRSKIGKSSSIETDNDDEDSEENLHEYDLNDSNLSSKPLHPISGWNFRQQQIVGPNG